MTDPKAAIHNALRLARAVGGGAQGPTYFGQLLGKAGADADADLTPQGKMMQKSAVGDLIQARQDRMEPDIGGGGGGGGDGTAGGLGDSAPGASPDNAGSSSTGSPAGDGGGVMGMAHGGKADKIHPARKIPGFHIIAREMGEPQFIGER